jgi:hypothetical protein
LRSTCFGARNASRETPPVWGPIQFNRCNFRGERFVDLVSDSTSEVGQRLWRRRIGFKRYPWLTPGNLSPGGLFCPARGGPNPGKNGCVNNPFRGFTQ